jgi:hypothetical protein
MGWPGLRIDDTVPDTVNDQPNTDDTPDANDAARSAARERPAARLFDRDLLDHVDEDGCGLDPDAPAPPLRAPIRAAIGTRTPPSAVLGVPGPNRRAVERTTDIRLFPGCLKPARGAKLSQPDRGLRDP